MPRLARTTTSPPSSLSQWSSLAGCSCARCVTGCWHCPPSRGRPCCPCPPQPGSEVRAHGRPRPRLGALLGSGSRSSRNSSLLGSEARRQADTSARTDGRCTVCPEWPTALTKWHHLPPGRLRRHRRAGSSACRATLSTAMLATNRCAEATSRLPTLTPGLHCQLTRTRQHDGTHCRGTHPCCSTRHRPQAVFPLQLLGMEVDPINSVQFSNHTGYSNGFTGERLSGENLWALVEGMERNGSDLRPPHWHPCCCPRSRRPCP